MTWCLYRVRPHSLDQQRRQLGPPPLGATRSLACLPGEEREGGCSFGQTDELGSEIVENGVHVHDYHATILHLMGLDHTRLTYRYAGRDFRLTDVSGRVVREILA